MIDALRLIDHPLVATLGWTLTHFLWQGAVLGLAAFFVLRVARPAQASVRYVIGVLTLAAMLLAPIATFVTTAGQTASGQRAPSPQTRALRVAGAAMVTGAIVANVEGNPAALRALLPPAGRTEAITDAAPLAPVWLPAVTAIWMLGVTMLSLRMLGGWMLAQWLAGRAVRAVSDDIAQAAHGVARRLGVARRVRVLESAAVSVPTLVGWLKPVVLLPAAALAGLSPAQLQAILAHELAHVRRHDYLVNLLQTFVETLLFYHPAVWWVSSEIRAEREHCCDDLAVATCGDRLVYVSALAELTSIERRAFALAATDGSLVARVRRILGRPGDARRELPPSWGILVLLVLIGGGAGTYEMSADASDVAQMARAASAAGAPVASIGESRLEAAVAQPERRSSWPAPPAALAPPPVPPVPPQTSAPVPPPPPTPPTPPTPPSPPTEARGHGNFVWSDDNQRLTVKWTGAFRLSDDERDIAWVEEGAQLTLADGWVFTDRVELRGRAGGQLDRTYYRSGVRKDFDAGGREFLASALQRMIRNGMFATERVARLLRQGGPDAVLAEVDRLQSGSSYVKRAYYAALLKQADLSPAQLAQLIERSSTTITSDYEKATVLSLLLQEPNVTDEQRAVVARAAATLSSDYEQRKVLIAALAGASSSPAVVTGVLATLPSVSSGHERSTVLLDIVRQGGVTADTSASFMQAVATMTSAYEQRRVLAALASTPAIAGGVARDSLRVATAMGSSHEKAEVLLQVIASTGVTEDTSASFFEAVRSLGSSHDQYRVLSALTSRGRLPDPLVAAFLRTTPTISGGHERSRILLELLRTQSLTGANRTLFLDAAEGLSGSHDRNEVLAALVRTERR